MQFPSTYAAMNESGESLALLASPSGHFEGLLSQRWIETWTTEKILEPETEKAAL